MKHRNFMIAGSLATLVVIVWTTRQQITLISLTKQTRLHADQTPPKVNEVVSAPLTPEPEIDEIIPSTHEEILEIINQAAVTYNAKSLPLIQPYLTHADPAIREAAKNGMIVIGDIAAAPILREASRKVSTPQEAVALQEAASYLELPSVQTLLEP